MVLHGNAKDLEAVHSDSRGLDSLLAFQDHVNWPCEETNEGISLARRQEYLGELEFEDLAHNLQSRLQLCSRVPSRIFVLRRALLGLSTTSSNGRCCRLLGSLCLDCSNRPLQEKTVYLEESLMMGDRVLLVGGVDIGVNRVGLCTQAAHDQVEDLAEGVGREVCGVSGIF